MLAFKTMHLCEADVRRCAYRLTVWCFVESIRSRAFGVVWKIAKPGNELNPNLPRDLATVLIDRIIYSSIRELGRSRTKAGGISWSHPQAQSLARPQVRQTNAASIQTSCAINIGQNPINIRSKYACPFSIPATSAAPNLIASARFRRCRLSTLPASTVSVQNRS